MPLPKDEAWFPAKRYGYGWGWPRRWQGVLALALYICSVSAAGLWFERSRPSIFFALVFILTALLVALCAWKGERPRWRWGGSDDDQKG
jgi:hypothetical protein